MFGHRLIRAIVGTTSTDKNHNTSPTAASSGTDLNGAAAADACGRLRARLAEFCANHVFANVENGYGFLIETAQYAPGLIGSATPWHDEWGLSVSFVNRTAPIRTPSTRRSRGSSTASSRPPLGRGSSPAGTVHMSRFHEPFVSRFSDATTTMPATLVHSRSRCRRARR